MNNDIQTALIVLVVGMITVFVILALVVLTGEILIRIVNRFFANPPSSQAHLSSADTNVATPLETRGIPKQTLAAIVSTVDIITEGKGKIKDIHTK